MAQTDPNAVPLEIETLGRGTPLLFLHGGDYFLQNRPFFDRLARRRQVIIPRHPGFGGAARPDWFRTVGDIAYRYLDLLDERGLDETVVVGASFGGWVALEMAVRSPARIGRLVLIDSLGVKFSGREARDIADIHVLSADELVRHNFADPARFAPDYAKYSEPEMEAVAADRAAAVLYGWRPYMHDPALVHWLHRIAAPTLVLWGAEDRVVAPDYGERLAAAIPGARFQRIAGAGHHPQIENPDAVAEAIEGFTAE